MARIRTIKPEFWTSAQIMECSVTSRLLFLGMLNFADDKGRMTASPKKIRAQVFPSDDITVDNITRMLEELSNNDLITLYEVDNVEYIQIDNFRKHQRIDKPYRSIYPDPDGNFDNDEDNIPKRLLKRSKNIPHRNGMEGKGS